MAEWTTFDTNGQWVLHKNTNARAPGTYQPKDTLGDVKDKQYKVYHNKTGELHEDHGQKGVLHDFGGGYRPKQSHPSPRNIGKVPRKVDSVFSDRDPGAGEG